MRCSSLSLCCQTVLTFAFGFVAVALAQTNSLHSVSPETEERIRDIYERNVYQARRIQAEWLADSSGFLASTIDSLTGKPSRRFFEAKTGQSSEATENQLNQQKNASSISPDGN
jgi:hypothetical protein